LAVKTASEMTYTVSGGALNSTQSNQSAPGRLYGPVPIPNYATRRRRSFNADYWI